MVAVAALGRRGTRPGRGEGPQLRRPLPPTSPSPAATVRGAERGPERRASAPPPSMRVLWIGKGAGWGGRVETETVSGPWFAQVLLCADCQQQIPTLQAAGSPGLVLASVREFSGQQDKMNVAKV